MRPIRIGSKEVGQGKPVFIIAEGGVNHNGNIARALRMVDAAARAGADAVKFQIFTPEELVSTTAKQARYQTRNTGKNETQYAMLSRLVLTRPQFKKLKRHTESKGLLFLSTPFSARDADFLESLDVRAFKIPSGEITNMPLLAHIARKKRPIILSTGMATLQEVREAIHVLKKSGAKSIVLLQCTTEYPTPPARANLRVMETFRKQFNLPIGFSDHTEGLAVSVAAVARGACIVEKHFTLNRALPGPDHKASLEPDELKEMVKNIRIVEKAFGSTEKKPSVEERANAPVVRRSVVAKRPIAAGTRVSEQDVHIVRPGTGIQPRDYRRVIGKKARKSVSTGTPLSWRMLE